MKKVLTLCIIHQGDKVLLGLKKRGFGVGKWNGFGGKVAEGEAIHDAAHRELHEEAGIHAGELQKIGMLEFSWKHNQENILEVHIFKCREFHGNPVESEEMKPQWFKVDEIPFEKMWADDKYWMPLFLQDKTFTGKFVFDANNNVAEHELKETAI